MSRIPKQVRAMKMRDFGAKYNGNIQAALRGVQRDKFVATGATEIDKSTRKRKWVASQEAENDASEKATKNARLTASPHKKPGSSTGPGTAQRARILAAAGAKSSGMVLPAIYLYCGSLIQFRSRVHLVVLRAPANLEPHSMPTPRRRAPDLFPVRPYHRRNSNNRPTRPHVHASLPLSPSTPWSQRHRVIQAAVYACPARTKACSA